MYNVHAPYLFHQKKRTEKCILLECQCVWDQLKNLLQWGRDHHFTWSSEPREGPAVCRTKEVPLFLRYLKTISNGPALGIDPSTCHSVMSFTDWISLTKRFDRRALHSVHYNSITYLTHDHSRFVLVHQDDNNTSSSILWEKKEDEVINRF